MPVHAPIFVSSTQRTPSPSAFFSSAITAARCARVRRSSRSVGRPYALSTRSMRAPVPAGVTPSASPHPAAATMPMQTASPCSSTP